MMHDVAMALAHRYVAILRDRFGDQLLGVALFGSVARGEANFPGSDIDLLIILEGVQGLSFGKRIDLLQSEENKLEGTREYRAFLQAFTWPPSFQEHVLTLDELARHSPLLLDLTTDAIILYDTGVVSIELERLKKRLDELGAKKIRTGTTWFWILKPDLKLGEVLEL
jgi:predicted nucleotidyltransferase